MKTLLFISSAILFVAGLAPALAQQDAASSNYLVAEWQRAKDYSKEYLDAMPEDGYAFKPTPEVRSFAQQFLHLGIDNYRFASQVIGKPDPYSTNDTPEQNPAMQSKTAVTKFVLESYDFALEALKSLTAQQMQEKITIFRRTLTREQVFFKFFEHQTHHRGQTTVYLRLKGVTPPREVVLGLLRKNF